MSILTEGKSLTLNIFLWEWEVGVLSVIIPGMVATGGVYMSGSEATNTNRVHSLFTTLYTILYYT